MTDFGTGLSGFIGSHLVHRLPDLFKIDHDKIDCTFVRDPSRFFFLSAYGNMAHHKSAEKILKANVLDLGNIVSHMMTSGQMPELFLYMSSSSVNLPVQTMYSRTKMAGEQLLQGTLLTYCIVRPFSVTGVSEQKEHLIPTLIRSCIDGEEMDLVPDAVHDWIDVEDLVDGLILLADQKATGIFEMGSGLGWSNLDVMGMVEDITGRKANVKMISSLRDYDSQNWYCKNFDAAQFGWVPKKSLAHSITEMVAEYLK